MFRRAQPLDYVGASEARRARGLTKTPLHSADRIPLREWPYRAARPGCGQSTVALNRSGSGLLSFLRPRSQVAWIRKRGHAERELEQALVERIIETL